MALAYTKYPADTFETLQINAGVIAKAFNTSTGALVATDIIGATTGGIQINCTPNFSDFGEDVDNVPNNTKQLKVLNDWTVTASGAFVSMSAESAEILVGAGDLTASSGKIAPRADLEDEDFRDIWFIGDYGTRSGNGGFIAVKLIDALSTGGWQLKTEKANKGQFSFEFTGHYDLTDENRTPPFEIYVKAGSSSNNG
jgi:hypothetical protein